MQHGGQTFIGHGHARDEELIRLRRELTKLNQKREFLAEAAPFFARQPK
jgi:transposase